MAKRQKKTKKKSGFQDAEDLGSPFANAFGKLSLNKDALPEGNAEEEAAEETPAEPKLPSRVVLRVQRKGRGGKTVTLAECSGHSGDLKPWLKKLKKGLGVGATLEGDALVFQGDLRERLAEIVRQEGVKKVVVS